MGLYSVDVGGYGHISAMYEVEASSAEEARHQAWCLFKGDFGSDFKEVDYEVEEL